MGIDIRKVREQTATLENKLHITQVNEDKLN